MKTNKETIARTIASAIVAVLAVPNAVSWVRKLDEVN